MLTWLDEWCDGMRFRRTLELARSGKSRDAYCASDGLAAREATLGARQKWIEYNEMGLECPAVIAALSMYSWFLAPSQPGLTVRAYQLTNAVADLLEETELTQVSVQFTREAVDLDIATYIDLPPGTLVLGSEAELRAIFIQPLTIKYLLPDGGNNEQDVLCYSAIVAPKGKIGFRFAIWTDDRSQFVGDEYRHLEKPEADMPTLSEFLSKAEWSSQRFQDEVERLTYLTLEHARQPNLAENEMLPHLAADSDRRRHGRGGDVARRFSLFRVERLTISRNLTRISSPLAQRKPWRLGRRIDVKPHWRRVRIAGTNNFRAVAVCGYKKGPENGLTVHPIMRIQ